MSTYIPNDFRGYQSEGDREIEERNAYLAEHPPCYVCDTDVCLVGEKGRTDSCHDAELGVSLAGPGRRVVHLGRCREVFQALGTQVGGLMLSVEL